MAIRGAVAKQEVIDKILECFPNAFIYEKTVRIPMTEDGQDIQIKLTLTAAKDIVEPNGDKAIPTAKTVSQAVVASSPITAETIQPTPEERANVERFLKSIGKI